MSSVDCGSGGGDTAFEGLRVASLFIIWATGSFGAFFPVIAHRSSKINLPHAVFESVSSPLCQIYFSPVPNRTAKYFGSGVIIATAFIHLLSPGISELTSPCLGQAWQEYVRILSPMVYVIAILISAYDVALSPGTCSPIVVLHIYYRGHRLPHWHSQAQEAWHQTW